MHDAHGPRSSEETQNPDATPQPEFGCGAFAVMFLVGSIALAGPFVAAEFASARSEAISLMWRATIPGAVLGIGGAIWRVRAMSLGRPSSGWARPFIGILGVLGYIIASQSGPRFLGAVSGFIAGAALTFLLAYMALVARLKRSERRRL